MKFEEHGRKGGRVAVAPLAGAWIEIPYYTDWGLRGVVAPLAGAWIEIFADYAPYTDVKSLPSRERGLKFELIGVRRANDKVAPLAGAWIEILRGLYSRQKSHVAPLAGAWIEISTTGILWRGLQCRSPRGSVD